jgi:nucleoside phosphorylase
MDRGRRDTARVGVLTIVSDELLAVRGALDANTEIVGTGYYTGDLMNPTLVLRQSAGRGNTPATMATRDILEDFRPELVVLVGIAGGIGARDDIRPGDVVCADYLHYSEFRKIVGGTDRRRYSAYDQPSVSILNDHMRPAAYAETWRQRIAVRPPDGQFEPKVLFGSIVAGEKLLGDLDHEAHQYVIQEYDDALAVDMESFGFARAIHEGRADVRYNPRLAVIRGVSDIVPTTPEQVEDNNAQRRAWRPYAAAAAGAFASEVIGRFLDRADPRTDAGGQQ